MAELQSPEVGCVPCLGALPSDLSGPRNRRWPLNTCLLERRGLCSGRSHWGFSGVGGWAEISPVRPSCLAHSAIGWSASFGQGTLPAVSSFLTRLPPPSTWPGLATSFILAGILDSHTPSPCLSQPWRIPVICFPHQDSQATRRHRKITQPCSLVRLRIYGP